MKSNILFLLTLLGILITYVICYKVFTDSLYTMVKEMEQQFYTIGVRDENSFINK